MQLEQGRNHVRKNGVLKRAGIQVAAVINREKSRVKAWRGMDLALQEALAVCRGGSRYIRRDLLGTSCGLRMP